MSTIDTAVNLGGIKMKNPVTVASGTFGYGAEYAALVDIRRLGAVTVKGVRMQPWPGNPLPRHVEVTAGMINAIGLQGPGVNGFINDYLPALREFAVPVIVNIWGTSQEEYADVAGVLNGVPGVSGIEINVSCPNVKEGGHTFGADPATLGRLVAAVRKRTTLPLLTKLAPNVPSIAPYARAAAEAGADALSLINTMPAMAIDIESRRPVLANIVGGLSGPAIRHVAVKIVWEAAQAVSIPIVAMGGINAPEHAIELMLAGATAVAVGTANFIDPTTSLRVIDGISDYCRRHHFGSVRDLTKALIVEKRP